MLNVFRACEFGDGRPLVSDAPDDDPDAEVTTPDASDAPFPKNLFLMLAVVAVVLPPIGMLIGAFNMDKPLRRKQSQLLLGIGLVAIVVIILFSS